MFSLITVFFSLSFISLVGWTFLTYVTKDNSQKFIKEELGNMFEITKMLLISIKSLIQILATASFPSNPIEESSENSNKLDEQLLNFVQPISGNQEDKAA